MLRSTTKCIINGSVNNKQYNMKVFYLSLFLIFLFTSCNDEMETEAQLTAKKLKADIGAKNIQSISVSSVYDGTLIFVGSSYAISSDGFIVVKTDIDTVTFNLGELKSYQVLTNSLYLYY
jgi:hypothetical protein